MKFQFLQSEHYGYNPLMKIKSKKRELMLKVNTF
jgi:hypothetical protein